MFSFKLLFVQLLSVVNSFASGLCIFVAVIFNSFFDVYSNFPSFKFIRR